MHIKFGRSPRHKADVSGLAPAGPTTEQMAVVRSIAERELRAAVERIGKTLTIAESRVTVDLMIKRLLANQSSMISHAIKDLLNKRREAPSSRYEIGRALQSEAESIMKSPVPTSVRAMRRPSAPRGADVFRLNLTLSQELDAEIDDVGYRARATGGARLAKTEVIRAACRLLLELKPDLNGVRDEDELLRRLRAAAGLGGEGKK